MSRPRMPAVILVVLGLLAPLQVVRPNVSFAATCVPKLTALTVREPSVVGGRSAHATVALSCTPTRRVRVRVRATPGITVPAHVDMARRTKTITIRTELTARRATGRVKAAFRGRTVAATLTRKPAACRPQSVTLAHSSVAGGTPVRGTVTLTCLTSYAAPIRMSASAGIRVPADLTVPRNRRSVSFDVATTVPARTETGTITAALGRRTATGRLTMMRCAPTIDLPATANGGSTIAGRVGLSCDPPSPVTLRLSTSDPRISLPETVTVPAGAHSTPVSARILTPDTFARLEYSVVSVSAPVGSASDRITIEPGIRGANFAWAADPNIYSFSIALSDQALDGTEVAVRSTVASPDMPATVRLTKGYWLFGYLGPWHFEAGSEDQVADVTFTLGTSSFTLHVPVHAR